MSDDLVVEEAGPVATFSFNRPAAKNALTLAMLDALAAGIGRCAARNDLRAVVLRGHAESPFSAGYNVAELPERTITIEDARAIHAPVRAAAAAILACPHPVIAVARTFVFGAALDLYAHCDLRVCAAGTTFCMPPNRFGFLYPSEGIERLVNVMGLSEAGAMLLLGTSIPTERALASGLVQRVVDADSFERDVAGLIDTVVANAPLSMRGTKRALNAACAAAASDATAADRMYAEIAACLNSDDVREGRTAFREKRAPRFQGR